MTQINSKLERSLQELQKIYTPKIHYCLNEIKAFANSINLVKPAPYVITVAGTNGKGSTVTLLAKLLLKLGYKVATFTSPHLVKFNERITVNGQMVTDNSLLQAFSYIKAQQQQSQISLSFFEFITLSAWYIFSQEKLDFVVLEIGMGGAQDAVNAIDNDLAIITSVDFDHIEYLGNTLNEIALQKAGIIRAQQKVIVGDEVPSVVVQHAHKLQAEVWQLGQDFHYQVEHDFKFSNAVLQAILPMPQIIPTNAALALQAVSMILQDKLDDHVLQVIKAELANFSVPGRLQQFAINGVSVLLDVAHNVHAVKNLQRYLIAHPVAAKNYAIFGGLQRKDLCSMLALMQDVIDEWYFVPLDSSESANKDFYQTYPNSSWIDNIPEAFRVTLRKATIDDRIIIFGSFYTVGPIINYCQEHNYVS